MTTNKSAAGKGATAEKAGPDEKRKHKTHHRSPNYPSISLTDAITKAGTVYDKEKRSPTSSGVIANHLGFPTLTGPAGRVVSALKQYGLLEEVNGRLRISDLAFRILMLPAESLDRHGLIKKAALKPQLFKELVTYFKDALPSDATLREFLIFQKTFNPTSVDQFIRIFKSTIDVAKPYDGDYAGDRQAEEEPLEEGQGMETPAAPLNKQAQRGHAYGPTLEMRRSLGENIPASYTEAINQRISNDCRVKVLFEGAVTQEAIQKLIKYLELGLDDYPTKKAIARRLGIWRNKDVDQPVTVIGEAGITGGRRYVRIEGSDTAIPEDEVEFAYPTG